MNSPTPEKVSEKTPLAKPALDSAERILSLIGWLTSNTTDELDKAIAKLERLEEFLKFETGRAQQEIGAASNTRSSGREKLKRWPSI